MDELDAAETPLDERDGEMARWLDELLDRETSDAERQRARWGED